MTSDYGSTLVVIMLGFTVLDVALIWIKIGRDEPVTYAIYTWDHERQNWHEEAGGLPLWSLRQWMLRRDGWSEVSVLIERES